MDFQDFLETVLVRTGGVEPPRTAATDFKSAMSTVPSHGLKNLAQVTGFEPALTEFWRLALYQTELHSHIKKATPEGVAFNVILRLLFLFKRTYYDILQLHEHQLPIREAMTMPIVLQLYKS